MTIFCAETDNKNHAVALLRLGVMEQYGIALPQISKDAAGKPFFPDRPDIYFSYSHTKTHVLCAISDQPVGADIETRRQVSSSVMRRLMSSEESKTFDFFQLWTLRESFYKLRGSGDLRHDRFLVRDGRIMSPDSAAYFKLYDNIHGCAAAVASLTDCFPDSIMVVRSDAL